MAEFLLSAFADEAGGGILDQIDALKANGLTHIEPRGLDEGNISNFTADQAKALKKVLDDHGIGVSSIGSHFGKINIKDDFTAHFESFKQCVENANILGTPNIRMFSFYVPEGQADRYADEVMRRLDRLAEYAAKQDVVLLHENEKAIYGDMAVRCKAILERFYGPHFQAVFDFANFVQCGQDTLEAYALLRPYIAYIHIKDALFEGGRVTPAGWGQGNVKAILADLKASGYAGYLSLEPHLTDFTGFRSLENGHSEEKWRMDGETAWRIALDALKAILWELDWQ